VGSDTSSVGTILKFHACRFSRPDFWWIGVVRFWAGGPHRDFHCWFLRNNGVIDQYENKIGPSDGAIWITDPLFGNLGNYEGHRITPELPTQVYRLDPKTGRVTVAASGIGGPDGIAFSPDEKRLYIVDTGLQTSIGRDSNIRVFDVNGEKLTNGRIFVPAFGAVGRSDGVRTDLDGNATDAGRRHRIPLTNIKDCGSGAFMPVSCRGWLSLSASWRMASSSRQRSDCAVAS
jgi:WD40 repeat protein